MRAATTHSAGTTLFTFTALKWTITTIQGVGGLLPMTRTKTPSYLPIAGANRQAPCPTYLPIPRPRSEAKKYPLALCE